MPTSPSEHEQRARHRFRWRACSSSARYRLRRNRVRRLGGAGRAAHRRRCARRRVVDGVPRAGAAARGGPHRHRRARHGSGGPRRRACRCAAARLPAHHAGRRQPSSCRWCGVSRGSCPHDVRVLDIARAAAGFDARFSALRRHYVYRLSTAPYGVEPQEARFVTAWPRPLDVDAMAAASRDLVGLHDFAAFCRHREGATTIRDLQRLDWVTRRRPRHRVRHRRRVLLVDGALVGRRAAGGRRAPPRTRLVRHAVDVDAALQRLRRRAAARSDARRRGLSARRPTRGAHEGHPRSAGASTTRSGPRRSRPPDSPCLPGCTRWRGGRASCLPRCSGRPGCRSGRRRGTTRWSGRGRAG